MYQIKQVRYLKERVKEMKCSSQKQTLFNEVAYLELIIHVGIIFNDFLMKSTNRIFGINCITRQNIFQLIEDLNDVFSYFSDGLIEARKRKELRDEGGKLIYDKRKWELTWFDKKTINNVRITLSGCISYSQMMLDIQCGKSYMFNYIPVLFFNQSNLEAQFSLLRHMKLDTAAGYGAFVNKSYEGKSNKSVLINNKCYDPNENDDYVNNHIPVQASEQGHRQIETISKNNSNQSRIIDDIVNKGKGNEGVITSYFGEKEVFSIMTDEELLIWSVIGQQNFNGTFRTLFLTFDLTADWMRACQNTEEFKTFQQISELNESESEKFEYMSSEVMNYFLKILLKTRKESRRSIKKSSFEYHSQQLISSNVLKEMLKNVGLCKTNDNFVAFVLVETFRMIFKKLLLTSMTQYKMNVLSRLLNATESKREESSINDVEDCKRKIHGIVGWAIKEAEKKFRNATEKCKKILSIPSEKNLKRKKHIVCNLENAIAIHTYIKEHLQVKNRKIFLIWSSLRKTDAHTLKN